MQKPIRFFFILFYCFILACSLSSCAYPPKPISEELRSQLGTLGIVSARYMPDIGLEMPPEGAWEGAGRAAGAWSRDWAMGVLQAYPAGGEPGALLAAAMLALTPVVAAGGAVYGAVAAEQPDVVRTAKTKVDNAVKNQRMHETLRDQVLTQAREKTTFKFVLLKNQGPTSRFERVDYSRAAHNSIDTILEVAVETFGLDGPWEMDPPLAMVMKARGTLINAREGTVLYQSIIPYLSRTYQFSEWVADDAKLFREHLEQAYRSLSEKMVEELFLVVQIPAFTDEEEP